MPSVAIEEKQNLAGLTYAEVGVSKNSRSEESQPRVTFAGFESQQRKRYGRRGKKGSIGPDGFCVCLNCGEKVPHELCVPCRSVKCPKCGNFLVRE